TGGRAAGWPLLGCCAGAADGGGGAGAAAAGCTGIAGGATATAGAVACVLRGGVVGSSPSWVSSFGL
ncbi:MAG: hypothetical protein UZ07_CHB004001536, partial [Chlorobi bacterium OLB7]